MKSLPLAVGAALILIFGSASQVFGDAAAACKSAVQKMEATCADAAAEVHKGESAMSEARAAMADQKDLPGLRAAMGKLREQAAELEKDPALSLSQQCTRQGVQPCLNPCANFGTAQCESDGSDKKREDMIRDLKALEKELAKTEADSSDGQADGKGGDDKNAKKDDKGKGGQGGGMPEIPKPEKKNDEPKDRSCGGQNPDPACPPKDDPCMKDPRSLACLCPGGVGSDPKCKHPETPPTARNTGGDDGGGGGRRGNSSQSVKPSEGGANEMSNGSARVSGSSSFGGGRGGGGTKLGGGGGGGGNGASSAAMTAALAKKLADAPGGGFSGGGGAGMVRGGSAGGARPSKDAPKNYAQIAENTVAIAHRRISGVGIEIGGRAGNIFESVSRAYRTQASTLRK